MNPYTLDLPAVVSFSGGRSSGFMLWNILEANPDAGDELKVCFQNTGLEHPATYDFIERVEDKWCQPITWLEYAIVAGQPEALEVRPETASREGEPFTALIEHKGLLPTPVVRICTTNLKIRTLARYLKGIGWTEWTNAVGLRADEPRRALRIKGDIAAENVVCPMFHAGHTLEDVEAFWREHPFDLDLPLTGNMAGNCVGCFLKSRGKLEILMEEMPEHFDWWAREEGRTRHGFRNDRPHYQTMLDIVRTQGSLFPPDDEDTTPCMCTD